MWLFSLHHVGFINIYSICGLHQQYLVVQWATLLPKHTYTHTNTHTVNLFLHILQFITKVNIKHMLRSWKQGQKQKHLGLIL